MLESLRLIDGFWATLILFIIETSFSGPLAADSYYPVVPSLDIEKLVCYMQTADGRTLNLDTLCRKQLRADFQTVTSALRAEFQTVTSALRAESQLVVSDIKYKGEQMTGSVVNKSDKTLYDAKVHFEFIGKDGKVIDKGVIYTNPPTLSPGQTATLGTYMPSGTKIRITSVE